MMSYNDEKISQVMPSKMSIHVPWRVSYALVCTRNPAKVRTYGTSFKSIDDVNRNNALSVLYEYEADKSPSRV